MASETRVDRLEIQIGATFEKTWPVTDSDTGGAFNPAGCLVESEVRTTFGGPLLVRFASDSSGTGTITFDAEGNMTLHLDPADTAVLEETTSAVWDLILTDTDAQIWPLLEGRAFITPEVTTGE